VFATAFFMHNYDIHYICIYRLIHGHFHIGLVIIQRPPYWPETESRANMGRGMITRPIWKCPCIIRDYYMTFSISALVLARDSHIKPDSEAGGLTWVEGWYQGPYGKFHVIIFLSHILHWPFPSIDFYIAKKIFEQTNCENKSLRELPLFNLQIFLFRI
jgi:hypothetical protein